MRTLSVRVAEPLASCAQGCCKGLPSAMTHRVGGSGVDGIAIRRTLSARPGDHGGAQERPVATDTSLIVVGDRARELRKGLPPLDGNLGDRSPEGPNAARLPPKVFNALYFSYLTPSMVARMASKRSNGAGLIELALLPNTNLAVGSPPTAEGPRDHQSDHLTQMDEKRSCSDSPGRRNTAPLPSGNHNRSHHHFRPKVTSPQSHRPLRAHPLWGPRETPRPGLTQWTTGQRQQRRQQGARQSRGHDNTARHAME
jgi:hypothetical protein